MQCLAINLHGKENWKVVLPAHVERDAQKSQNNGYYRYISTSAIREFQLQSIKLHIIDSM